MNIRAATVADVPAVLDIYNEAVLNTTASYDYEPQSLSVRFNWYEEHMRLGFPIFVAEDPSGIITGWGSLSEFRYKVGYRFTVENSLYVAADYRRRGIGKLLLTTLIDAGRNLRMRTIIAGIDADNVASLNLHEKLGFERVAYFKQVGFKFERWLDLIFLQRML